MFFFKLFLTRTLHSFFMYKYIVECIVYLENKCRNWSEVPNMNACKNLWKLSIVSTSEKHS